jgi:hypothetical protein
MGEFSYHNNGLHVNQYGSDHICAQLSTLYGHDDARTVVEVAHFPQAAAGAENQCGEFYALEIKVLGKGEPYSSTSVAAHLSREDIERLHFATGELLAQSKGLERGAAHCRVVCDPQDEAKNAGCDSCGVNDRAEGFDTCQDCRVVDPEPVGDAEEQFNKDGFNTEKVSS